MFSFFKKKTPPPAQPEKQPEPSPETDAAAPAPTPAPEAAPTVTVPTAPLPRAADEADKTSGAGQLKTSAVEPSSPAPAAPEPARRPSWTERLKAGLSKTRDKLGKSLAGLFGGGKIDEDLYEELETVLLTADMGVDATTHLLKDVRERVSLRGLKDASELKGALKDALADLIEPLEKPLQVEAKKPFVIMLAGVNGAGKTTSIGKLAKYYQSQGKSVLLAAGDTFRAAAREQLMAWGERNNVTVIAQQGGDAAAVCFDAIKAAEARGIDIVLADTAGRLPTQLHLMEEIRKVKRVIQKARPDAPHEVVLVLDANIGQNALNQVKAFDEALGLTGLILTKLDGTAKGGVIAAIAKQHPVPLRFIGVGESIDDLRPFSARDYVDALFD
ncbi:signal recognition particle-docking protein FtsY [Gulbenkiania mobilis]|uniref:Signal recognition particle receptor FtsY n=1 Tax=Gulbenkiania mobilis TaxID=397457 RepID=A0ABY2CYG4_GULMO|nr:fused signal recognition particle receptor [Gulbenkiania mobilis]